MTCYNSIPKLIGLACGAALLVSVGWFCTTLSSWRAQIAGWSGVVFFGICFIGMLVQLCRTGPAFIVDEKGINDLRLSLGVIPWADVAGLWIGSIKSQPFLCIEVYDTDAYLARLPIHKRMIAQSNPLLGFPPITVGFSGLTPGIDDVWRYLQAKHPEKITTSPTE